MKKKSIGCLLALLFTLAGCSGAKVRTTSTAEDLLASGRYAEAKEAALKRGKGPDDRAVVAAAWLAEDPSTQSIVQAARTLAQGPNDVDDAVAATKMLDLMFTLNSVSPEVSIASAEAAMGSVGRGRYSVAKTPGLTPGSEAAVELAVMSLERLYLWSTYTDGATDASALLEVWNGAYSLMGGSLKSDSRVRAWRLFTSIGSLAVFMEKAAYGSDLSKVLLRSAVTVVEQNPDIAIPVRCDLASPFDGLRTALARDRKLLSRLENAVVVAKGCSRGQYAPKED